VRNGDKQPTFHSGEASPQILLLTGERFFQYPFENLFMAKLQSLLDSCVRIKGSQAGVFIPATGEIAQGSQVGQPGK